MSVRESERESKRECVCGQYRNKGCNRETKE